MAVREPTFKISTIGTYKSIFKEHLYPAYEDREIENITLSEWIDFFDKISQKSRVTSGAVLKLLKAICNLCVTPAVFAMNHDQSYPLPLSFLNSEQITCTVLYQFAYAASFCKTLTNYKFAL